MMRGLLTVCVLAFFCAPMAFAESLAQDASDSLMRAASLLEQSESASDRIGALTDTVRAYEAGLQAMRGEVRRLTLRKRDLQAQLAEEDADAAALLVLMQDATLQTQTRSVLHPGSAPESIRAGILARALVPSLLDRASRLQAVLGDLADTEQVLAAGTAELLSGLAKARDARVALAGALSARQTLPDRLATDEAAFAALIGGAETLAALADVLEPDGRATGPLDAGAWARPVSAEAEVQVFENADEGWSFRTLSAALVTAPVDATIRFAGEVPGFASVAILEADGGVLVTLAGMADVFVNRDEVVGKGAPLGFMGGAQDKLNADSGQSRLEYNETLYMEIRQAGVPVDPGQVLTAGQE